ncbi:MAG: nucleotidyl transferase AbiEii/AbiGii toxin family protein [Thiohalobacteraceae bacterium]
MLTSAAIPTSRKIRNRRNVSAIAPEFYLDLVPFGGVESETQQIAWPPQGDFVMSVAGFHDALTDAVPVRVNDRLLVPVVSPAGLLLLKLLAWNERRNQKPGRDASDIAYVLRHAVRLISGRILFEEHLSVVDRLGYDIDRAAAYVLGGRIRALASAKTREKLLTVLAPPATEAEDAMLVRDVSAYMLSEDSERVGARLRQLEAGFEAKPDMDTA